MKPHNDTIMLDLKKEVGFKGFFRVGFDNNREWVYVEVI